MAEHEEQGPMSDGPESGPPQPNLAALAALDAAIAQTSGAAAADGPAPAERPSSSRKPRGKRKRPSRRELEDAVRAHEPEPAVPPAPVIAGNDEAKGAFAAGIAKLSTAIARAVARRRGVHWQLDEDEATAIGESAADCLEATERLAPSLSRWIERAATLAPFAMLAGVSYEIIDSRLEIDAEIAAGRRSRVMPGGPAPAGASAGAVVQVEGADA